MQRRKRKYLKICSVEEKGNCFGGICVGRQPSHESLVLKVHFVLWVPCTGGKPGDETATQTLQVDDDIFCALWLPFRWEHIRECRFWRAWILHRETHLDLGCQPHQKMMHQADTRSFPTRRLVASGCCTNRDRTPFFVRVRILFRLPIFVVR